MNASDIIKAKQSQTLYQAYYRPTLFPTIINSTINICPVSSNTTSQSFTSTVTVNYLSRCLPPVISYELANSINEGKYICGFPYCSTISEWNTGRQFTTGNCDCDISFLTWRNTNPTIIYNYSTTSLSTSVIQTSTILTGPSPIICPLVDMVQGTSFQSRCNTCGATNGGYCNTCSSGQ